MVGLYGVSLCLLVPSVLNINGFGELCELLVNCRFLKCWCILWCLHMFLLLISDPHSSHLAVIFCWVESATCQSHVCDHYHPTVALDTSVSVFLAVHTSSSSRHNIDSASCIPLYTTIKHRRQGRVQHAIMQHGSGPERILGLAGRYLGHWARPGRILA